MDPDYIALLIEKYANRTITGEEYKMLMQWYRSVYHEVPGLQFHDRSERENLQKRILTRLKSETSESGAAVFQLSRFKVAASILVGVGVALLAYILLKPPVNQFYSVKNPQGRIVLATLPDNSRVWLNAGSVLEYHHEFKNHREVKLQGEAYFEVTHDQSHPFVVQTNNVTTTVVGTAFNIRSFSEEQSTSVSVTNGKVKVSVDEKPIALITPAKGIMIDSKNKTTILPIDTSRVVSWKNGRLRFDGQTLRHISKELERWYGYSFNFNDPGIAGCRYYLNFDNNQSISEVISVLKELSDLGISVDHSKKSITLAGDSCK